MNYIAPTTIRGTGLNGDMNLGGIDLITSIEMMLVKDYDDQLRSMGKQVKMTTKVKQAYREQIEKYQKFLLKKAEKDGDKNELVTLDPIESQELNREVDFIGNTETMEVEDAGYSLTEFDSRGNKIKDYIEPKEKVTETINDVLTTTGFKYRKTDIETKIEMLKQKLDSLNEQSELMSLGLQSLTNQRKIAFETVSNIIKKEHEGLSSITRNI